MCVCVCTTIVCMCVCVCVRVCVCLETCKDRFVRSTSQDPGHSESKSKPLGLSPKF